jgi:tRNA pseudouridine55 synthase
VMSSPGLEKTVINKINYDRPPDAADKDKAAWQGVMAVSKPVGVSSFRIVQKVRHLLGIKKVGHTGTLDPFASGVLVICVGRPATRLISRLMEGDKEYEATLQLGVTTETQDPEGSIIDQRPVPELNERVLEECLENFRGKQLQTPPSYSALKHKGKPLYYYARRGIKVDKEPRQIEVKKLSCLDFGKDTMTINVVCSKGTYIRTLAADIGEFLGCGAYLSRLTRVRNGFFCIDECLPGEVLFNDDAGKDVLLQYLLPVEEATKLLV